MTIDRARKKELARAYRERRRQTGIYAVRCGAAERVWIAATHNLDKQKNSLWFMLRSGSHPNREMQSLWNERGEQAFVYEILEEVADENPLVIDLLLKEKAVAWRTTLGADPVIG